MNIEKLVSVIRSLAQLDSHDSQRGVENLAGLVWAAAGMDSVANQPYARDFRNYCCNYLRTYQAQIASDKAQGIVICLYTDGIVKTTQFPSPTDWDKCLCAAASEIYTAYGEAHNKNGSRFRVVLGDGTVPPPTPASKPKTPRLTAKGGSK